MNNLIRQQIEEIYSALSRITGLYGVWAKEHGLSYNALLIIYTLEENTSCTQKQICDSWLIPKQTVNTILSNFKEKGYVKFDMDSNNRKEKIISFTELGQQYSSTILIKLHSIEETVMNKMGVDMCKDYVHSNNIFYELLKREIENNTNINK